MDVEVVLYRDEDGVWVAECPSVPGTVSQGSTEEEAVQNHEDALRGTIEVRKQLGLPPIVRRRTVRISA